MSVSRGDEVVSVLCEADGFDLGGHLVGGHLDVVAPVPNVDDHVVLGTHRDHILVVGGERLENKKTRLYSFFMRIN